MMYQDENSSFDKISTEELNKLFQSNSIDPVYCVNTLLVEAVKLSASDILIEPRSENVVVRYRIDGVLQYVGSLDIGTSMHVIARIKVLSNLDPTDKRRVQEGLYNLEADGRIVNLRVEIAQTVHGELVVVRIHEKQTIVMKLSELGLNDNAYNIYNTMLSQKSGLILVCGPTGSGKTTTLYSTISELNSKGKYNIMTIENPVEFQLEGINQMQTSQETDFDFAAGLRTILRLSPDVILVGEIRDNETVNIAIESGLTGQLVLSTIHAEDSIRSLFRLLDLKVDPYLLNSALVGIVAQRLVRKICQGCKTTYQPSQFEIELIQNVLGHEPGQLIKGNGCPMCSNIGFRGRTGIYEVLPVNSSVRNMIRSRINEDAFRQELLKSGFSTLLKDGLEKAEAGITTVNEALRNSLRIV